MNTYTVTLSGLEREDGEKPYDYVVYAHHAADAVRHAFDSHMEGRSLQDEDNIWVERCVPFFAPTGYFNDLRKEIA